MAVLIPTAPTRRTHSAAEKEYQEPNSVLIKTIAKTSGHTVLVRKPIDLEASSAMKKKLAFEFDQMEREGKKKS